MSPRQSLTLSIVIAFAAGVLITDIVRDFRDAELWAVVARERVFWAWQEVCSAQEPGQRAVQTHTGERIDCIVYENTGYGRAPRPVRALTFPTLDRPLAEAK